MGTLSQNVKTIKHANNQGAGATTFTPTSGVDTAGFEGCRFICVWGVIDAGGIQSIEVHQSSDDGNTDSYTAIAGSKVSLADTDDNKLTIVDVYRPRERYLKCIVNRSVANSTPHAIIAELYDPSRSPIADDSTALGNEVHLSPAEGTA